MVELFTNTFENILFEPIGTCNLAIGFQPSTLNFQRSALKKFSSLKGTFPSCIKVA